MLNRRSNYKIILHVSITHQKKLVVCYTGSLQHTKNFSKISVPPLPLKMNTPQSIYHNSK